MTAYALTEHSAGRTTVSKGLGAKTASASKRSSSEKTDFAPKGFGVEATATISSERSAKATSTVSNELSVVPTATTLGGHRIESNDWVNRAIANPGGGKTIPEEAAHEPSRNQSRLRNKEIEALTITRIRQAQSRETCYCAHDATERKRLERRVSRGDLVRPYRAMYVEKAWWNSLDAASRHRCLVRTLAYLHPNWVFCGITAAVIWGFSVPYYALNQIHVARHKMDRYQSTDTVRFHALSSYSVVDVGGIHVTTAERTALDCMRTLPFAYGLAVADSASRICGWEDLRLAHYLFETPMGRPHGLTRARLVALLTDTRSESGGESIARANMIREGFALPELQVEVPKLIVGSTATKHRENTATEHPYRVDFAWMRPAEADPIYGELDGRAKYTDAQMLGNDDALDVLLRERRRESCLSLTSKSIVRFSFEEANTRSVLSQLLEVFGVPRVREPLSFTSDARHNLREIRNYLQANCPQSTSARSRLDFLDALRGSG